jgi:hypothetical protein
MMKKNFPPLLLLLTAAVILSACTAFAGGGQPAPQAQATVSTATGRLPTDPPPTATARPLPTETATPLPMTALAEQAAQDYFSAMQQGEFPQAASLLSNFSLMVFELTRGEAATLLASQYQDGAGWDGLEIVSSRQFSPNTVLVQVKYSSVQTDQATGEEAPADVEETWSLRLEDSHWRINLHQLIDFRSLDTPSQTTNGLTIKPVRAVRYTDRLAVYLLVQNRSSEVMVLGQANETLAALTFSGQTVPAEQTRFLLNPQRTLLDAQIEVRGFFESYPDGLEIRRWNNTNTPPWFVFALQ